MPDSTARQKTDAAICKAVHRHGRRVLINKPVFNAAILGEDPDPNTTPEFVTIPQLTEEHRAFSEAALRQMIARAEKAVSEGSEAA